MASQWYVLRSKPNKEDIVWQQVQAWGFETFYPRLQVRPVNPRSRKIKPYFPGYLFVRADLSEAGLSTFQYMPYAVGLVCFGGEPAYVPEALINAIRLRVGGEIAEAGAGITGDFKRNDPVWILDGPFAGYEAIFDTRIPGRERVRVLLQMLDGRNIKVEMYAAQLESRQRS
jgi:transcription antitermination factor NusG